MKNILLFSYLVLLLSSCSSTDSNDGQTSEDLSNLLTQNAWVYDNAEIIDITSHGSLSYAEAEQILLDNPLNSSNSTLSITSFDSDGTGSIITPNSSVETINFGWIILPNNTLRLFLSSTLNDLGVFEFTVNEVLLTLTNDQEYLYQGTLIKYKVKGNYNKQ
mgnify:CR=1 FL=1